MGLWDDFYQSQVRTRRPFSGIGPLQSFQNPEVDLQPVQPTSTASGSVEQHPIMQLISALLAPKQQPVQSQGNNLTSLVAAMRNDPVGDANKTSSMPSYMPGSTSPFNTGFFKPANERYADMVNKTGAYAPTDLAAHAATLNAMANAGMRKDYVAPTLSPARLHELFTNLYKNPRSLYQ